MRVIAVSIAFGFVLLLQHTNAQEPFPDRCIGVWQGTMYIHQAGSIRDSVRTRFTVKKLDSLSWTWKMEYLSTTRPIVKDYVLRTKDFSRGVFVTDEGDGIELTDQVFGDKMYCVFDVSGLLITASYELRGDKLVFEVTSGPVPKESVQEVRNYPVSSLQRVEMIRIE